MFFPKAGKARRHGPDIRFKWDGKVAVADVTIADLTVASHCKQSIDEVFAQCERTKEMSYGEMCRRAGVKLITLAATSTGSLSPTFLKLLDHISRQGFCDITELRNEVSAKISHSSAAALLAAERLSGIRPPSIAAQQAEVLKQILVSHDSIDVDIQQTINATLPSLLPAPSTNFSSPLLPAPSSSTLNQIIQEGVSAAVRDMLPQLFEQWVVKAREVEADQLALARANSPPRQKRFPDVVASAEKLVERSKSLDAEQRFRNQVSAQAEADACLEVVLHDVNANEEAEDAIISEMETTARQSTEEVNAFNIITIAQANRDDDNAAIIENATARVQAAVSRSSLAVERKVADAEQLLHNCNRFVTKIAAANEKNCAVGSDAQKRLELARAAFNGSIDGAGEVVQRVRETSIASSLEAIRDNISTTHFDSRDNHLASREFEIAHQQTILNSLRNSKSQPQHRQPSQLPAPSVMRFDANAAGTSHSPAARSSRDGKQSSLSPSAIAFAPSQQQPKQKQQQNQQQQVAPPAYQAPPAYLGSQPPTIHYSGDNFNNNNNNNNNNTRGPSVSGVHQSNWLPKQNNVQAVALQHPPAFAQDHSGTLGDTSLMSVISDSVPSSPNQLDDEQFDAQVGRIGRSGRQAGLASRQTSRTTSRSNSVGAAGARSERD